MVCIFYPLEFRAQIRIQGNDNSNTMGVSQLYSWIMVIYHKNWPKIQKAVVLFVVAVTFNVTSHCWFSLRYNGLVLIICSNLVLHNNL